MAEQATGPSKATEIDDVVDLNPTAFVDDVYNAVELHCAAGFEELDNALRTGLSNELSPEQLTILLQGTAGLYQDLRVEVKKRMKVFEEYALAEILKLPPGLLANPVGADVKEAPVDDEEEMRVDEELKTMQLEIAESKQKGRDMRATMKFLDKLMKDVKQKLSELEAVPNVLGSTQTLEQDVEYITKKGSAIEDGCKRLDALQGGSVEHSDDIDKTMVAAMNKGDKTDKEMDKDILAHYSSVKQASVDDLRSFRESLLRK